MNDPARVGHMSPAEFRAFAKEAVDFIADYWESLEDRPVTSSVRPGDVLNGLPMDAPETGEDPRVVLADIQRLIVPALTHWQSPRFFGYFPANASFPAIVGELLSAGLGVNGMLWATSPAATELETRVLDWLGRLVGLPEAMLSTSPTGGGVIQGTASEATLVALVAARARAVASGAEAEALTVYASSQAHSSVVKAAMIAGLAGHADDRSRVRLIGVDHAFAMDAAELEHRISNDIAAGLGPALVVATVGTTGTTAIDPVRKIGELCTRTGAWVHVDAAMNGCAWVCPEFRWMMDGMELVDSVCFNPHKWLLVNFDCDCLWTRDRQTLTRALSITPEYLKTATSGSAVIDYRDWQVPLGRRMRSLKLWMVLRHYGASGLRAYIREHVRIAQVFEELIKGDARFELVTPRTASLVCFRVRGKGDDPADGDARSRRLLERVNATGRVLLTHTVVPCAAGAAATGQSGAPGASRYVMRLAVGSTLTREEHVREAWSLLSEMVDGV